MYRGPDTSLGYANDYRYDLGGPRYRHSSDGSRKPRHERYFLKDLSVRRFLPWPLSLSVYKTIKWGLHGRCITKKENGKPNKLRVLIHKLRVSLYIDIGKQL